MNDPHAYRKRTVVYVLLMLGLFLVVFLYGFIKLKANESIFDSAFGYAIEDSGLMFLSLLAILKLLYELIRIESHHEYDAKLKKHLS